MGPHCWGVSPMAEPLRTLTVRQPWASLIALGVKTIETRSKRTHARGRIAIHAALCKPELPLRDQFGDHYATIGDWRVERDYGIHRDFYLDRHGEGPRLEFGAVVATADLVDCRPIVARPKTLTPVVFGSNVMAVKGAELTYFTAHGGFLGDYSDQLTYGDFTPGRWAWMLDNITPVDPPAPHRGAQHWTRWTPGGEG